MSTSAKNLYEEALKLGNKERAELIGLLLETLDGEAEDGAEGAWIVEIERRMEELDSGSTKPVPWEDVEARLLGDG